MAQIKIELSAPPVDGMDIKFQAPCDCTAVTGMVLHYPAEDGSTATKALTFRDAHGNNLAGIGHLFAQGAYVKVIVDVGNGYAYLQNADTNAYLNSAIFGKYTQDNINLTGSGENGKFKATESGTFGSFNVNGEQKQVKCGGESSMDLIAGCWYTFILDGDTINFSSGGAGAGLNFKVVGGTDEPVSPSENTIWVNTDTPITGWVFASEEPSETVEGMVWIQTSTSSPAEFNALKKNGIRVYPLTAKQYIDGELVSKTAKTYQGGVWVDWFDGKLYSHGNECLSITGGWESRHDSSYYSKGTVTKKADRVTLSGANETIALMKPVNPIDLTGFTTITVFLENLTRSTIHISVVNVGMKFLSANFVADTSATIASATEKTISLDISALSAGEYELAVTSAGASSGSHTADVVEVLLQ